MFSRIDDVIIQSHDDLSKKNLSGFEWIKEQSCTVLYLGNNKRSDFFFQTRLVLIIVYARACDNLLDLSFKITSKYGILLIDTVRYGNYDPIGTKGSKINLIP